MGFLKALAFGATAAAGLTIGAYCVSYAVEQGYLTISEKTDDILKAHALMERKRVEFERFKDASEIQLAQTRELVAASLEEVIGTTRVEVALCAKKDAFLTPNERTKEYNDNRAKQMQAYADIIRADINRVPGYELSIAQEAKIQNNLVDALTKAENHKRYHEKERDKPVPKRRKKR